VSVSRSSRAPCETPAPALMVLWLPTGCASAHSTAEAARAECWLFLSGSTPSVPFSPLPSSVLCLLQCQLRLADCSLPLVLKPASPSQAELHRTLPACARASTAAAGVLPAALHWASARWLPPMEGLQDVAAARAGAWWAPRHAPGCCCESDTSHGPRTSQAHCR